MLTVDTYQEKRGCSGRDGADHLIIGGIQSPEEVLWEVVSGKARVTRPSEVLQTHGKIGKLWLIESGPR